MRREQSSHLGQFLSSEVEYDCLSVAGVMYLNPLFLIIFFIL